MYSFLYKKRKYYNYKNKKYFIETDIVKKSNILYKSREFNWLVIERKIWKIIKNRNSWITLILANCNINYESKIVRFKDIKELNNYIYNLT